MRAKKYGWVFPRKGMSLVELLVVIVIIGILATILLLATRVAKEKSKVVKAKSDVSRLGAAFQNFYNDNRVYPNYQEDLTGSTTDDEVPVAGSGYVNNDGTNYYSDVAGLTDRCNVRTTFSTGYKNCSTLGSCCYDAATWQGPYITSEINVNDPWGRPYIWDFDYFGPPYERVQSVIKSYGADGDDYSCDDIYKSFYSRLPKTSGSSPCPGGPSESVCLAQIKGANGGGCPAVNRVQ